MLVLNAPCVWHICRGVVYHSISLIIRHIIFLVLKSKTAIVKFAVLIRVELVNLSCKYQFISKTSPIPHIGLIITIAKEIQSYHRVTSFQQTINQLVVSPDRNTLVSIVEIIIVKYESHWQAFYDKRRKVNAFPTPLLLGIFLYKNLVDVPAYEHQCLLLKILGFAPIEFFLSLTPLIFNYLHCLSRSGYVPHP